ncbi:DUF4254 domain-containing protein [Nocardia sp. NPDC004604]|uniref:DUF4254 domain-containing protein n=1 Tax=Nocardia sp. NPDC004604 TaxID=3157013 RepID=UPI0033A6882C
MLIDPLPTKGAVLRACRGVEHTEHPLLQAAYELTCLHERRRTHPSPAAARNELAPQCSPDHGCQNPEIDTRRTHLVREIDHWIHANLPPAHGSASVHTETLGTVIDRLAAYTATAYTALTSPSDHALGEAWERLAELAIAYEDLTTDLTTGRRRLPGGP